MLPGVFFFSSRRRYTSLSGDWSSDVCSSDLGDGKSLADFQDGFIDYWKSGWTTEEYVGRLIAPNMVWMKAYEDMTESGTFGTGRLEKKLLKDIELRSKYEIMLEYGLSSRIG